MAALSSASSSALSTSSESESATLPNADDVIIPIEDDSDSSATDSARSLLSDRSVVPSTTSKTSGSDADNADKVIIPIEHDSDSSATDSPPPLLRERSVVPSTTSKTSGSDADTEEDTPPTHRHRRRGSRHKRGDSRHRTRERQHLGKTLTSLSSNAIQVEYEGIDAILARLDNKKEAAKEASAVAARVAKLKQRQQRLILSASKSQNSNDSSSAGTHKKDKGHTKHQRRIEKLERQLLFQQAQSKYTKGEEDLTEAELAALNTDPEFRRIANQSIRDNKFDPELYAKAVLALKEGKTLPPGGIEELTKTKAGREVLAQTQADKPSDVPDARKTGVWTTIFLVAGWLDTQFNSKNDVGIKAAIFIPLIILGLIYTVVEKKFLTQTLGQKLGNNIASNEAHNTTSRYKTKDEVFSSLQEGLDKMTQAETT